MDEARKAAGWGGRRPGAGRKPKGDVAGVAHRARPDFEGSQPLHVTVRMLPHVGNLKSRRCSKVVLGAFSESAERNGLRLTHVGLRADRIDLLVEAESGDALSRGMQGISIRLARGLNRLNGASGTVFADRFDARLLRTADEVRAALEQLGSGTQLAAPRTRLLKRA